MLAHLVLFFFFLIMHMEICTEREAYNTFSLLVTYAKRRETENGQICVCKICDIYISRHVCAACLYLV